VKPLALVVALLLAGCTSLTYSDNYRPQNSGTALNFYACEQLSTTPDGGINFWMVRSCMSNRNYRLARPPGIAVAIEVVTLPLWFPIDVLTGGRFSDNMAVGDVPSE